MIIYLRQCAKKVHDQEECLYIFYFFLHYYPRMCVFSKNCTPSYEWCTEYQKKLLFDLITSLSDTSMIRRR